MAEKILNTRILMKVDTLENWQKSTLGLKKGELAIATVASSAGTGLTEPVCMIKIGEDGIKTFSQLEWNLYAKASDVLSACKSEAGLTAFIKNVIAATDGDLAALAGRVTTAEGEIDALQLELDKANTGLKARMATAEADIDALEAKFGAETVALEIEAAISALNLADTYAAKVHKHEIADVNGLSDSIAAAKKAGTDANAALEAYKTTNNAAVKVNSDAIAGIKNGTAIDSFAEVETALAGKQAVGDYATKTEAQAMADGKDAAIQAAHKAGTDAAAAAAQALVDAKKYTDDEITEWVGDKTVGVQISETIANYSTTAQMNTAINTAKSEMQTYVDNLDDSMNKRVQVVEDKAHEHHFVEAELNKIDVGDVNKWNNAEQNAKDYADELDEAMDARVLALEGKFTGNDSVAKQIEDAVAAEAELREAADAALQAQIGAASADGKAATGLHARIEDLEELVGDDKVSEAIEAAVKVEENRAKGVEGGLDTRLAAVEADYLKAADKKALQDQIDANESAIELLTNGVKADEVDGVNDLIQYVKTHGTEVTGMKADIKQNADDIDALEGRMETAEGDIAKKAAKSDLEELAGRVTTIETEHNAESTGLKARLTAAEADIVALDGLVGDETVSKQITDVTDPLTARVVELEKVDHSHANAAELNKIADGDKAKWDAKLENVTATADSGLKATKTGNSIAIEVDDTLTWIFDCGGAGV